MTERDDEFFIGWSHDLGAGLRRFLSFAAISIVVGLGALSMVLAVSITDPARSLFGENAVPDLPQQVTLSGMLSSEPYPFLLVGPDATHPSGHGVMLSGDGKRAAEFDRAGLVGQMVEVTGLLLKRGALDMLVLNESPRLLQNERRVALTAPQSMGRWRVVGEICDGKCGAGIMSPGTGIAHKACASLCLIGGVPPVLVITHPLEGHQFLMISDNQGRALDNSLLRFIGMRVEIEGEVERRGDVALMRIQPGKLRRL
jgi:hypothetical protein